MAYQSLAAVVNDGFLVGNWESARYSPNVVFENVLLIIVITSWVLKAQLHHYSDKRRGDKSSGNYGLNGEKFLKARQTIEHRNKQFDFKVREPIRFVR